MMNDQTRSYPEMDDEIDLFELAVALWRGRWIILACVAICALAATAYALLTPQQWASTAQVKAPQLTQFGKYMAQRQAIMRVIGNKPTAPTNAPAQIAQPVEGSDLSKPEGVSESLFDSFVTAAAVASNKRNYLQDTDYFQTIIKDVESPSSGGAVLTGMASLLRIQAPGKDQVTPYYTISFSAATAQQAQDVLTGYLAHVNALALQEVDEEFRSDVDGQLLDWEAEMADTKIELEARRKQELDELARALEIAKKAGIKDYLVHQEGDGGIVIDIGNSNKTYMLGQKYLSAELDTIREAPLVLPASYYQTQSKLVQVGRLLDYTAEAQAYSYVLPPTLPVHRTTPKRKLIAVVGVLVGGMVGGLWVLLADALRRRRAAGSIT